MNQIYLLVGGNLGNREELIQKVYHKISNSIGEVIDRSSLYESEPWGFKADQNFLNQVLLVKTNLNGDQVLTRCQNIENELGRKRGHEGYASRTMDIDILFFNDEIIDKPNLTIPHPQLHKRRFTLEPLVEIAPDFVHPIFHKKLKLLLEECDDNSVVIRLNE